MGTLALSVTPADDLIDVSRGIVVTGLAPGAQVGIVAQTRRGNGVLWHSRAAFVADAQGTVDLTRDAPVSGDYTGVSAMGIIWSQRPEDGTAREVFPLAATEPLTTTLTGLVIHFAIDLSTVQTIEQLVVAERQLKAGQHAAALFFRPVNGDLFPNQQSWDERVPTGKLLEHLEGIIRESVKPMEKIDGIKILHVDGINGGTGGNRNVTDEVIASLNASWPGTDWAAKADYNLDRMMVHGLRRAAEMEEVAKTLDLLGTGAAMTRGTIERQREIGTLGLTPPDTLPAKIDTVLGRRKDQAA